MLNSITWIYALINGELKITFTTSFIMHNYSLFYRAAGSSRRLIGVGVFAYTICFLNAKPTLENEELVKRLNAADVLKRNEAFQALWQAGELSIPTLERYRNSTNPEVRFRVTELLDLLYLGIKPEDAQEKIDNVDHIRKATDTSNITEPARSLFRGKSYETIIRLYLLLDNQLVKEELYPFMDASVRPHMRELYLARKFDKAEELLLKLPMKGSVAPTLASLYQYQGKIAEAVQRLDPNVDEQAFLLLHLHIISKNWQEALAVSELLDLEEPSARLEMLMGDPHRLSKLISRSFSPNNKILQEMKSLSFTAADFLESGDFESFAVTTQKLERVSAATTNTNEILARSHGLILNGMYQNFDQKMEQFYLGASYQDVVRAVNYAESCDKPDEFLIALGLPSDKNDLIQWAKGVHESMKLNKDKEFGFSLQREVKRLIYVVALLNSRNEREIVREILNPLFDMGESRLKNQDLLKSNDVFDVWVRQMIEHDYTWYLAERLNTCSAVALNEIFRILHEVGTSRRQKVDVKGLADLFSEGLVTAESVEKLMLLTGIIRSSENFDIKAVETEALEKAAQLDAENPNSSYGLMIYRAAYGRGAVTSVDELSQKIDRVGEDARWLVELELQMATGKWKEASEKISLTVKEGSVNPSNYLLYGIALEKLGRKKEAQKQFEIANLYAAGEAHHIHYAMSKFSDAGLDELYVDIFEHSVAILPIAESKSQLIGAAGIIGSMNLSRNAYLKLANWKMAHSVALTDKYLSLALSSDNLALSGSLSVSNQVDMTKGLVLHQEDPEKAEIYFRRAVQTSLGGGRLADFYFPALKKIGWHDLHKESFLLMQPAMLATIEKYPFSPNTLNSYAWTCAMSGYDLERAEKLSKRSLKYSPSNAAHLDTLAAVYFAKGNRKKAIEYSNRSLEATFSGKDNYYSFDSGIKMRQVMNEQMMHFKTGQLP